MKFFVQVPYKVDDDDRMWEVIIEFLDSEDVEAHEKYAQKKRCYHLTRKPCIFIRPEDLNECAFAKKIEEFVRQEIPKNEPSASISLSPLEDLPTNDN